MMDSSFQVITFLALVAILTNCIAWRNGFYQWSAIPNTELSSKDVMNVFFIYCIATFIIPVFLVNFLAFLHFNIHGGSVRLFLQLLNIAALIGGLWWYCSSYHRKAFCDICKSPYSESSYWGDIKIGVLTWLLAFPLISLVGYSLNLFLYHQFGFENYEQTAVRYLKNALSSPFHLILALLWILILAPIAEEFLFRGVLQTYLKKKFSIKPAILIVSFCFALFHFSPLQGLGNFALIPSLFIFSCFLGFIYERQHSLLASISLHATLNLITSLRILLFSE